MWLYINFYQPMHTARGLISCLISHPVSRDPSLSSWDFFIALNSFSTWDKIVKTKFQHMYLFFFSTWFESLRNHIKAFFACLSSPLDIRNLIGKMYNKLWSGCLYWNVFLKIIQPGSLRDQEHHDKKGDWEEWRYQCQLWPVQPGSKNVADHHTFNM